MVWEKHRLICSIMIERVQVCDSSNLTTVPLAYLLALLSSLDGHMSTLDLIKA